MEWLQNFRIGILFLIAVLLLISCSDLLPKKADEAALAGTRTLAEEAYVWAYPMLMNYKSLNGLFIEENSPAFRAPFNQIKSDGFTFDHTFKTVVTPNADTSCSILALDLRAEPQVLKVPAMPHRYYAFQCVDLFTHNFEYIGTRATGSEAGRFLFAGPGWQGEVPEGVTEVLRPETDLVLVVGRTQLRGLDDLPKVVALQEQYSIQPLSGYLGESAVDEPPPTDWPPWNEAKAASPDFVEYVNFLLAFCEPLHPADARLMKRFAAIGISPGQPHNPALLDPEGRKAAQEGIAAAREKIAERATAAGSLVNGWTLLDTFGNRAFFAGDHLLRAAGAWAWLHGNSKDEILSFQAHMDGHGDPLDGSKHDYVFTIETDNPPPAMYFWSVTLYDKSCDGSAGFLVENPIGRYRIDSETPGLLRNDMGDIVLYIQHKKPAGNRVKNWLPAPKAPFYLCLRIYGPEEAALDGTWAPTPIMKPVF